MQLKNKLLKILIISVVILVCSAEKNEISDRNNKDEFVGRMIEEGRTMVHHAMKRFMIILPAIFFKLGIAFTMLILVTLVSINNGFIGFLLLVVGLSSVLARLQESRRTTPSVVPYISPLPPYHHQHWLDRSDNGVHEKSSTVDTATYGSYEPQYQYRPLSTYSTGTTVYG